MSKNWYSHRVETGDKGNEKLYTLSTITWVTPWKELVTEGTILWFVFEKHPEQAKLQRLKVGTWFLKDLFGS